MLYKWDLRQKHWLMDSFQIQTMTVEQITSLQIWKNFMYLHTFLVVGLEKHYLIYSIDTY